MLVGNSRRRRRASPGPELRQRSAAAPPQPLSDAAKWLDGCKGSQDGASRSPARSPPLKEEAAAAEQPKESSAAPEPWSPLLTNLCLCTALAVGAYVCYRAYFH